MTKAAATPTVRPGKGFSNRLLTQAMQLQRAERDYMNEADKLALCARVKKAREQAGLTELEIAEMLDPPVTDRTIRNYETVRPPFRYLRQWAEITRVDYDFLLRGEVSPAEAAAAEADGNRALLLQVLEKLDRIESRLEELEADQGDAQDPQHGAEPA